MHKNINLLLAFLIIIAAFALIKTVFNSKLLTSFSNEEQIAGQNLVDQSGIPAVKGVYHNGKFNYQLYYPDNWFLGFSGSSLQMAEEVWFVSDSQDINLQPGSIPQGIKVKINIFNLNSLKTASAQFAQIDSLQDWFTWMLGNDFNLSELQTNEIVFNNIQALKVSFNHPSLPELGPGETVIFFDPEKKYIFHLNYMGSREAYPQSLDKFKQIVNSFTFN